MTCKLTNIKSQRLKEYIEKYGQEVGLKYFLEEKTFIKDVKLRPTDTYSEMNRNMVWKRNKSYNKNNDTSHNIEFEQVSPTSWKVKNINISFKKVDKVDQLEREIASTDADDIYRQQELRKKQEEERNKNGIQLSLFQLDDNIKPGVPELFESNPELANIGTQEQYSQYLNTIFPDSKVKDIVYHGTDKLFEQFSKDAEKATIADQGIFFAPTKNQARNSGKVIVKAVINSNPLISDDRIERISEKKKQELLSQGYNGYVYSYNKTISSADDIVVFEPEQIHILGSKQDIEGFKEFANQKSSEAETSTTPMSNSEIDEKIKTWLEKVGIEYKPTVIIRDDKGNEISAAAKADLINKIIEVIEGKRGIDTLPEEAAHFLVEMLGEDHPLYRKMYKDIVNYQVYNDVLNSEYNTLYKGNEKLIRKEAIGKLIAQIIIAKETGTELPKKIEQTESWFKYVWNFIKQRLGRLSGTSIQKELSEISAFVSASNMILEGDTKGLNVDMNTNVTERKVSMYQLDENIQSSIDNNINSSNVIYDAKEEAYFRNGNKVLNRVHDLVNEYYNRLFRNQNKSSEEESMLAANKGTIIHEYNSQLMQYIIDNPTAPIPDHAKIRKFVIDKLKSHPNFQDKNDKYFELTPNQYSELFNFMKKLHNNIQSTQELINKQTGTEGKVKIYLEQVLYDEAQDLAGTVDVLAVYSNGKASIFDYKNINFKTIRGKVVSTVPFYKQEAYHIQLMQYADMLNKYGVNSFVHIQALPINMQLNSQKKEDGFYNIQAGTNRESSDYREYLDPVPTMDWLPGIPEIDAQLEKMFKLRETTKKILDKNPHDERYKARFDRINRSIKKLQIYTDTRYVYTEIKVIIEDFVKRRALPKEHADSLTHEDIQDYIQYLTLYKDFFDKAVNLESGKEEDENKINKIKLSYYEMNSKINTILQELKNLDVAKLQEETGLDMSKAGKDVGWLSYMFNQLSEYTRSQFIALSKLVKSSENNVMEDVRKIRDQLTEKHSKLKEWSDKNGKSLFDTFKMIYNKETGELVKRFNSTYFKEKEKAMADKDYKWFLENTNIKLQGNNYVYADEESAEKFKQSKEKYVKHLEKQYPGKENEEVRAGYLKWWESQHDFTVSPEALFSKPWYIKANDNPRFHTDMWKFMNLPENQPLKDYYDYLIQLNKLFAEITDRDISDTFVAEIQKDVVDMMTTNGLKGLSELKTYAKNMLVVKQNDALLGSAGNIDPVTGEYINKVPLLFTDEITQEIKDKEIETLREAFKESKTGKELITKFGETSKEVKTAFKYYIIKEERRRGLENKSFDLTRSFLLFAEAAYTNHYMSSIEGIVKSLRASLELTKTEIQDKTNRTLVDKYSKKILTKIGVPKDELEAFDKFVNYYLYGQKYQNKDMLYGKTQTERDKIVGEHRYKSTTKTIRYLMNYVSLKSLGLSWTVGAGNAIQTFVSIAIKASDGMYFDNKTMNSAVKDFITKDEKAYYLMQYFRTFSHNFMYEDANKLSASKISKLMTMDNFYIFMKEPDKVADGLNMIAISKYFGIDENGKIKRLTRLPKGTPSIYETIKIENDKITGLNKEQYDKLREIMYQSSTKIKGLIPDNDINLIGTNIWLASVMQFKNWIPPLVKDRFKALHYNDVLEEFDIGRMRVLFGEFTAKGFLPKLDAFKETLLEVALFGKYNRYGNPKDLVIAKKYYAKFIEENPEYASKLTLEEFVELRKQKLQSMAKELRIYLLILALVSFLRSLIPDDDDKKIEAFLSKNAYRLFNRGLLEISFFLSPKSLDTILSRPVAVLSLLGDIRKVTKNTLDEVGDDVLGEKFQREYFAKFVFGKQQKKDKTPPLYYSSKLIPGSRIALDIFDIFDNMPLEYTR